MNEFDLINEFNLILDQKFSPNELGPGDDAAIVQPKQGRKLLVSKDVLVENVHFDLSYFSLKDIGWKALAVNESDICAMGGEVLGYLVGLAVPTELKTKISELYLGMREYLNEYPAVIYGGDISTSEKLMISVTVIGEAVRSIPRSGAKPGDLILLSRSLGASYLGLKAFKFNSSESNTEDFKNKHLRPRPERKLSHLISQSECVTSMIDVSDGLIQELSHLCGSSNVSMLVNLDDVNFAKYVETISDKFTLACGGEDYGLLFTATKGADLDNLINKFESLKVIGEVVQKKDSDLYLKHDYKEYSIIDFIEEFKLKDIPMGYRHF